MPPIKLSPCPLCDSQNVHIYHYAVILCGDCGMSSGKLPILSSDVPDPSIFAVTDNLMSEAWNRHARRYP